MTAKEIKDGQVFFIAATRMHGSLLMTLVKAIDYCTEMKEQKHELNEKGKAGMERIDSLLNHERVLKIIRPKAWAKRVPVYPDVDTFGQNKRLKYVVDCNAGLTDIFVNILRRKYRQQEQPQQVKPSVRDKLKVQPKRNSPKISANSKGQER